MLLITWQHPYNNAQTLIQQLFAWLHSAQITCTNKQLVNEGLKDLHILRNKQAILFLKLKKMDQLDP